MLSLTLKGMIFSAATLNIIIKYIRTIFIDILLALFHWPSEVTLQSLLIAMLYCLFNFKFVWMHDRQVKGVLLVSAACPTYVRMSWKSEVMI